MQQTLRRVVVDPVDQLLELYVAELTLNSPLGPQVWDPLETHDSHQTHQQGSVPALATHPWETLHKINNAS